MLYSKLITFLPRENNLIRITHEQNFWQMNFLCIITSIEDIDFLHNIVIWTV